MNRFFIKSLIITVLVFLGIIGICEYASNLVWSNQTFTIPQNENFQVSAVGEVYVKPDTAEINLGVEKEGKTVSKAQEDVNKINNDFINSLKEIGLEEKDIKTTSYSLNPRYEWDQNGKRSLNGYQAIISILIKTKDFDKINQILDKGTLVGINQINSISFTVEDSDKAKAEARDLAIVEAKEKAEGIAKASGLNLGRLLNVIVSDQNSYSYYGLGGRDEMMKTVDSASAQIENGETKISVNVSLTYAVK